MINAKTAFLPRYTCPAGGGGTGGGGECRHLEASNLPRYSGRCLSSCMAYTNIEWCRHDIAQAIVKGVKTVPKFFLSSLGHP